MSAITHNVCHPAMIYRQIFIILVLLCPLWVHALAPADPARFEKAIAAFEAEDAAKEPPKDVTLFVGASNIRRWT